MAYLGNRAAAALKLRGLDHLRQACYDMRLATQIDPSYAKGWARSAEAHYMMGEAHTVRTAVEHYERAVALEPSNKTYKRELDKIRMTFESDFAKV